MVEVPLLPGAIETEVGDAEIVKAGVAVAVTVRLTCAVWVTPPPVPVTVIGYVPAVVLEATVMVMVEVPEPGAAIEVGLKLTVTPVGCPEAVRATALLKVPVMALVMVEVPLLPAATVSDAGLAESEKPEKLNASNRSSRAGLLVGM